MLEKYHLDPNNFIITDEEDALQISGHEPLIKFLYLQRNLEYEDEITKNLTPLQAGALFQGLELLEFGEKIEKTLKNLSPNVHNFFSLIKEKFRPEFYENSHEPLIKLLKLEGAFFVRSYFERCVFPGDSKILFNALHFDKPM